MSSQPAPGVLERLSTREFYRSRYESLCEEMERSLEAERARALRAEGHARTLATQLLQREAQIRTLEAQLATLRSASAREQQELARTAAQHAAQLEEAARRTQALEETVTALRGQLAVLAQEATRATADAPRAAEAPGEDASRAAPQAARPAAMLALLERLDAAHESRILMRGRMSIGRTPDNALQLDLNSVSRHHAVIVPGPDYALVRDLGSTNGVLVNGRRVRCARIICGDVVSIGEAQFRLAFVPADEPEVS